MSGLILYQLIFPSCFIYRKDDGGRLDGAEDRRGERRDGKARTNRRAARDLRIRSDDNGVQRCNHYSSLLWPVVQTADESHGSEQAIAAAGVLLLRHG